MTRKRIILAVVVVAAVGAGAAYKFRPRRAPAIEVETAPVERRTIVQTVTANGQIQPKTQVAISADVSAKITKLAVKEGEWVEKGHFLLELDRDRYQAAFEVAQASLRGAESNAQMVRENMLKAQKDYVRIQGLSDRQLESPAQLDATQATAQAERARHRSSLDQVEQARAALKQAQDDLSKTRIYAPLAGTISKLNKEEGEIALGSQFQKDVILEISNLAGMEAVINVDENDIVLVSLGDLATIEVDALPGSKLKGEVTEIANSAKLTASGTENQKTEFEVKVTVTEANDKLRPGMTASAEVTTETKKDVIGVPLQCVAVRTLEQLKGGAVAGATLPELKPDEDGFVELVFVVVDGKAQVRQVKTGIQSDSHIEVVSGLGEGDEVVVGNYRAISKDLQQGAAVTAKRKSENASNIAQR